MAAADLLEQAIAAQGGERYDAASEIQVQMRCDGWAFAMRFQRGALSQVTGTVSTVEPRAVLAPFSGPGRRGIMERGAVRIESDDGEVLAERADPRPAFSRLRRKLWWDDLDLLYFSGYALWGYMNAPFVIRRPGFEVSEAEPWHEGGEVWRGLHVVFPPDVPAHSREQRYWFDDRGLLRRNDYTAEVFGAWAKASHYCWDHRELGGLVVPTRRKAMPRGPRGKPVRAVPLVRIAIDDVTLA